MNNNNTLVITLCNINFCLRRYYSIIVNSVNYKNIIIQFSRSRFPNSNFLLFPLLHQFKSTDYDIFNIMYVTYLPKFGT